MTSLAQLRYHMASGCRFALVRLLASTGTLVMTVTRVLYGDHWIERRGLRIGVSMALRCNATGLRLLRGERRAHDRRRQADMNDPWGRCPQGRPSLMTSRTHRPVTSDRSTGAPINPRA